ncbi:MAG: hypothetical protein ACREF4_01465 [Gammaproteobacteria bacterium]
MTLSLPLLAAYAHIVATVLLIGYALFWVVMTTAICKEEGQGSVGLLNLVQRGRWPPGGIPKRLRPTLPALGWVFLVALFLTGALLLVSGGRTWDAWITGRSGGWPVAKLALFVLLVTGQAIATLRPRRWVAYVNGGLAMMIVVVSALLRH